jgi:3-hydroxyisobutyrate dehydrogenase-like beta-hydroxyacid dehydrogenase
MTVIGIVSPGHMGSGLGRALQQGGARVVATTAGRSARTARLADGLELLPSLADVVAAADVVLSVTPPGQAVAAARAIADAAEKSKAEKSEAERSEAAQKSKAGKSEAAQKSKATENSETAGKTGPAKILADLNATSPETMRALTEAAAGRLAVVDGSISGPPPSVRPGARIYLSGDRAAEVAALPWAGAVEPIVLDGGIGTASALKMCTASVYKGLNGLLTQAMRTAGAYGVLEPVLADLARNGLDDTAGVAVSATKAFRFVDEMREIAATQRGAGLTPALFEAFAEVFADVAGTRLADGDPESVGRTDADHIVQALARRAATE